MAIDFPASPTNGQTFTSGSVTYTWDGTKWTAVAAAGSSNSISQGNTNATVTDTGSDGRFVVTTEGSERLRVDSSGRLGVGTASPGSNLHLSAAQSELRIQSTSGTNPGYLSFLPATQTQPYYVYANSSRNLIFEDFSTERMRIDSSGRLLVGTSTSNSNTNSKFQIADTSSNVTTTSYSANNSSAGYYYFFKNRGASVDSHTVLQSGDGIANLWFGGSDGTTYRGAASIEAVADGGWSSGDAPGRLVFSTTADGASSPTERMRIGNTGALATFNSSANSFEVGNGQGAGTSTALYIGRHSAGAVNTGTNSIIIWTNGNVQNTNNSYGSLSDIKLKENIVDASTQWNDIKALQVRKYNFKEETGQQTHTQIGLIAQEVELVSPGLVTESPDRDAEGNDLGTTTKSVNYSVLYMKAVKALQEAMERIETLEAKVAALESA